MNVRAYRLAAPTGTAQRFQLCNLSAIFTFMVEYINVHDTFAALSDQTRIAILQQLLSGPARVTELAAPHAMSLNSVSKHVKILENSMLVTREVRGREHWIRFNGAPLADACDWATTMLSFWTKNLGSLEALIEEDTAARFAAGDADASQ